MLSVSFSLSPPSPPKNFTFLFPLLFPSSFSLHRFPFFPFFFSLRRHYCLVFKSIWSFHSLCSLPPIHSPLFSGFRRSAFVVGFDEKTETSFGESQSGQRRPPTSPGAGFASPNAFDFSAMSGLLNYSLDFVYLSIAILFSSWIEVASWMHTGERQAAKMRMVYLRSMLNQDISLFDTEASTGEVIAAITSDIIVVQDAISEKDPSMSQMLESLLELKC